MFISNSDLQDSFTFTVQCNCFSITIPHRWESTHLKTSSGFWHVSVSHSKFACERAITKVIRRVIQYTGWNKTFLFRSKFFCKLSASKLRKCFKVNILFGTNDPNAQILKPEFYIISLEWYTLPMHIGSFLQWFCVESCCSQFSNLTNSCSQWMLIRAWI